MKDPSMAKYLEGHVSFNDMRAFVCETSNDMNKFMDIMKEEQKLRVNAVKTPPHVKLEQCQPKSPIQRYRYPFDDIFYRDKTFIVFNM